LSVKSNKITKYSKNNKNINLIGKVERKSILINTLNGCQKAPTKFFPSGVSIPSSNHKLLNYPK